MEKPEKNRAYALQVYKLKENAKEVKIEEDKARFLNKVQ
jgi:hypothetical protein